MYFITVCFKIIKEKKYLTFNRVSDGNKPRPKFLLTIITFGVNKICGESLKYPQIPSELS